MDEKLAVELAYKNGYEQGVKDLAERLQNVFGYGWLLGGSVKNQIDNLAKEMTEQITNKN